MGQFVQQPDIRKIELHYVFAEGDASHTLDAHVRNACEKAFLSIVTEIAHNLKGRATVVVEPHAEGGLRDIYTVVLSGSIVSVVGLFVQISSCVMQMPSKQDKLLKQLTIEKTTLEIEKLKRDAAESTKSEGDLIENLARQPKIIRQKSNFFKSAKQSSKIKMIEISEIDAQTNSIVPKTTVAIDRDDFDAVIVDEIKVDPEVFYSAIIEIIAPVLIKNKIQWKGIWKQGEEKHFIGFQMLDNDFQDKVQRREILFRHGTHIECILKIEKKVDDIGDIVTAGYCVVEVEKIYDDMGTNIMIPHRKRRNNASNVAKQMSLFDGFEN